MRSMKSKKNLVFLSIAIVFVVLFLFSYVPFLKIKVNNKHTAGFEQKLQEVMMRKEVFDMKDVTDFEWDQMYVFYPYTSRKQMEETVGKKWTTGSYPGYLLERTQLGNYPIDDESFNKLVFVRGEEVVLDVTLYRSEGDFTKITEIIDKDNSRFSVTENNILIREDL